MVRELWRGWIAELPSDITVKDFSFNRYFDLVRNNVGVQISYELCYVGTWTYSGFDEDDAPYEKEITRTEDGVRQTIQYALRRMELLENIKRQS